MMLPKIFAILNEFYQMTGDSVLYRLATLAMVQISRRIPVVTTFCTVKITLQNMSDLQRLEDCRQKCGKVN